MRVVTWVLGIAAVAWLAYWFAMALALRSGTQAWFDQQREAGLEASHEGITVYGFPGSFNVLLTEPRVFDPVTGQGWAAPELRAAAPSHYPLRIALPLPTRQEITLPGQSLVLTGDIAAEAGFVPFGIGIELSQARLDAADVALVAQAGWRIALDRASVLLRPDPEVPRGARLLLDVALDGFAPDPAWLMGPDGGQALPSRVGLLQLAAHADLAPLTARPEALAIDGFRLEWGEMWLTADGRVEIDPDGVPDGRIIFRTDRWRDMLQAAVDMGAVRPEIAPTWERVLEVLDEATEPPGLLEVPLSFQNGRMSLGPLPLGPAPRLGPG